MRQYRTICADPPWPFALRWGVGGRRARATTLGYSTMTVDAIAALPVADLALPDAHLYLWVTRDHYREGVGVRVARAWGFEPVSEIIWRKPNFGTGAFPRPGHEVVLICRRGKLPFAGPRNIHSVQTWKQTYGARAGLGKRNSAKPEALQDLIEQVSPGPYLELFARRHRLGWSHWGNEVDSDVEMAAD